MAQSAGLGRDGGHGRGSRSHAGDVLRSASVFAVLDGTLMRKIGLFRYSQMEDPMRKLLFVAAAVSALAVPAMAEEVGVGGPVGVGVTVGDGHRDRDYDRDRRDRTTVIKEREPADRTTVIKKDHDDGVETKTIIHHDD
jgi:hypothetical protein